MQNPARFFVLRTGRRVILPINYFDQDYGQSYMLGGEGEYLAFVAEPEFNHWVIGKILDVFGKKHRQSCLDVKRRLIFAVHPEKGAILGSVERYVHRDVANFERALRAGFELVHVNGQRRVTIPLSLVGRLGIGVGDRFNLSGEASNFTLKKLVEK